MMNLYTVWVKSSSGRYIDSTFVVLAAANNRVEALKESLSACGNTVNALYFQIYVATLKIEDAEMGKK